MQKDQLQEHYQSDKKPFSIIRKLGLSDTILGYRTPFDKSPYPAIENILRGAIKAFITSFGVKASLSLILSLIKYKQWIKNPKILLRALVNKDNAMMGCFIGSFTFILKLMIFLCRIIRKKDDGFNGFIAGFSAGYFSLFFTNQSGRVFLACLVLARAFDTYYNHLVNTGKIKKSKYHYVWIFAALNSITGYCYAHEDYLLSPAFIKFGDTVTCQSRNDLIMTRLYHEMTRRNLTGRGIIHDLIF